LDDSEYNLFLYISLLVVYLTITNNTQFNTKILSLLFMSNNNNDDSNNSSTSAPRGRYPPRGEAPGGTKNFINHKSDTTNDNNNDKKNNTPSQIEDNNINKSQLLNNSKKVYHNPYPPAIGGALTRPRGGPKINQLFISI
jgi:hypothetical protein